MQALKTNALSVLHHLMFVAALVAFSQSAHANAEYTAAWGPSIGAKAPLLSAVDQDGNLQNLESLSRAKGLLFIFNRSVDW